MNKAQVALYGLHIEAFLEGIAAEVPSPEQFGLTEKQAVEIRRTRFSQHREAEAKKVSAA